MSTICTHCGGSGHEPEALLQAARKHAALVNGANIIPALKDEIGSAGAAIHAAALQEREQHEARIVCLEDALRAILGRMGDAPVPGSSALILQVPNEDVANWRKVLDQ